MVVRAERAGAAVGAAREEERERQRGVAVGPADDLLGLDLELEVDDDGTVSAEQGLELREQISNALNEGKYYHEV